MIVGPSNKTAVGEDMKKYNATRLTFIAIIAGLLASTQAVAMKSAPGLPVKKISFADRINTWEVVDGQHLLVSLSKSKAYLLKVRDNCRSLQSTHKVGISSSNNTVYAGFDYVTADGQRCGIQSINKLTKAELASIKG